MGCSATKHLNANPVGSTGEKTESPELYNTIAASEEEILDLSFRWPDGVVHYKFDESLNSHNKIIETINEATDQYESETLIKFILYNPHQDIKDWILFKFDQVLSNSAVGRVGGEQVINVTAWATKGMVMHLIMHALGFNHENSTANRDKSAQMECISSDSCSIKGILLGNSDSKSIMRYSIARSHPKMGSSPSEPVRFTIGDLNAIKYLYLGPCCTYNLFQEDYFEQRFYECVTCWGDLSSYGICEHCKRTCHSDHQVIQHRELQNLGDKAVSVCDCGRNRHILNVCTRITTRERRVKQKFYTCKDCFQVEEYKKEKQATPAVCKACSEKCHAGHQLKDAGVGFGFCDCGRSCCKILCKST